MELFDKEFVYFMWDDKLEGQQGFVANYINELKLAVNQGYWIKYGPLHKGSDAYPFRTIVDERWCLCYCDPNYEAKKAFNEGKEIQFQSTNGKWNSIGNEDKFMFKWAINEGCPLRIKPDCPCEDGIDSKACVGCEYSEDGKKEYKPYESVEEFVQDFQERFRIKCNPGWSMPTIWVKRKNDKDERQFVHCFQDTMIKIDGSIWTLEGLYAHWAYLDGSPVGMEVKE